MNVTLIFSYASCLLVLLVKKISEDDDDDDDDVLVGLQYVR